jgi:DNA invertase Pin-like site-specific DNA recombinase
MKAAVYARKSNDDNDKNEENKSVTRQVDRAKAYAVAKGWTVDPAHVFVDDGISGADFEKRHDFHRLQEAAARGAFEVLVASEPSRLGRSGLADVLRLTDIIEGGVRVFYYLDDKEEKCDTFEGELNLMMQGAFAKQERLRAAQRSRDSCARKAEAGYNAGGRVYGYDNHQVWSTNTRGEQARSHTEYRINDQEAAVIREIFRMCADGHGTGAIAKTLNGAARYAALSRKYFGGQTPPSPWKGSGSWAPSSVRSILLRERYTGIVPFGEYRKAMRKGKKVRIKQPDYLKIDAPQLRIVDDTLWRAAQTRFTSARREHARATGGKLGGRPSIGRESNHLLSGLARCECCGATIAVLSGMSGPVRQRHKVPYYICGWNHNRGETVCPNDHRVPAARLDGPVIAAIEQQVLVPEVVEAAIERAFALAAERRRTAPDEPERLQAEIRKLRRQIDNLITLAADGEAPKSVRTEILARENRIAALEAALAEITAPTDPSEMDMRRLRRAIREESGRLSELLRDDLPRARQVLRKLLDGPVWFAPVVRVEDRRKSYTFSGRTRISPLIDMEFIKGRPQGDSNSCRRRERANFRPWPSTNVF